MTEDHTDQTSGDRITGADVVDGLLILRRFDGSTVEYSPAGGTSPVVVDVLTTDRLVTVDDLGALLIDNAGSLTVTVPDGLPVGFWFDIFANYGDPVTVDFSGTDGPNSTLTNVPGNNTVRLIQLGDLYGSTNFWQFVNVDGVPPEVSTAIANLQATAQDHETRIGALENP